MKKTHPDQVIGAAAPNGSETGSYRARSPSSASSLSVASSPALSARGELEVSPALRAMVEELRAEPVPELRWADIERGLFDRIARGEGGRMRSRAGVPVAGRLASITAAAATMALIVTSAARSGALRAAPAAPPRLIDVTGIAPAGAGGLPGAAFDRDFSVLRAGDAVESEATPISFTKAGVVRWTLAPSSRAVVVSMGSAGLGAIIAIERGTIRAEVEPRDASEGLTEAFLVEAGATRVAVHGTAFSVALVAERIVVDVEHGVVAVGPAGRADVTMGYSLFGPARASFSLDGARTAVLLPRDDEPRPEGVVLAPVSEPSAPAPLAAAPSTPSPSLERTPSPSAPAPPPIEIAGRSRPSNAAALPVRDAVAAPALPPPAAEPRTAEPPAAAPPAAQPQAAELPSSPPPTASERPLPTLTTARVKAGVERCFNEIYSARQTQVKLSIASTLRLTVRADGTVANAMFDPPLAPHFQICASSVIAGRFEGGARTLTIPVALTR